MERERTDKQTHALVVWGGRGEGLFGGLEGEGRGWGEGGGGEGGRGELIACELHPGRWEN